MAGEALSALVDYCFKELELHRMQAGVLAENSRSVNLFMKCNFRSVGKFKDSHILSILRTDWDCLKA
ncbi:MAG: GNAT family N-acetyltransferase [Planctomycetes bacterium]|nr:GNAT family N-acetyltransferase [Planctomycetota bacterium]